MTIHFDIILPTIGRSSLKAAVESVVNQDYKEFTLRILADGANVGWPGEEDPLGWQDIIGDTRHTVMLHSRRHNDFGAFVRNEAINQTWLKSVLPDDKIETGDWDWIAYIDDDDVWLPNHLSTLSSLLEASPHANMLRTAGQAFSFRRKSPRSKERVRRLGAINSSDILTVGMAHTRQLFERTKGWQACDNHDKLLWEEMLSQGGTPAVSDAVTFQFER